MNVGGWQVISDADDGKIHLMPLDDLKPHIESDACLCGGVYDDEEPCMFAHYSYDGREHVEEGRTAKQ